MNVTFMVCDRHNFFATRTSGFSTLVTLLLVDNVLGLTGGTGSNSLTLIFGKMMLFAGRSMESTVAGSAQESGAIVSVVIWTIVAHTALTNASLTWMMRHILGVEAFLTIQAKVTAIDERGK